MWEINNITQSTAFLWSVLLGGALSIIYDIFRLDRLVFKRSVLTVALEDLAFWIIAAVLTYCLLLLTTNGQVRAFVLIGVLIGFVLLRLTFSRVMDMLAVPLKKAVKLIRVRYIKFITKLAKIDRFFISIADFFKKLLQKLKNKQKIEKKL